jgi:para-nitrobenzyl esterase
MGQVDFEQDEDCLTLNIWAPPTDDGPHPVLLWIHGGGFSTGSGSWPFYSGAQLARNGRIIVATFNYRLGALGYLYVPGLVDVGIADDGLADGRLSDSPRGAANRGLLDQIAALSWVHDNIAAFGGDPEAITLAGQSAGGAAIAAMMTHPRARLLFKRAILQSPVFGAPASIDEATAICDHLLQALAIRRDRIQELRRVPINRLLAAQIETARQFARFGAPVGAIQQVVDGTVIQSDFVEAVGAAAATGIPVLVGTTRDEMDAFLMQEPLRYSGRSEMIRMLKSAALRGFTEDVFDAYSASAESRQSPLSFHDRMRTEIPAKTASAVLTDYHFRIPTLGFAGAWSALGGSVYLYRFDWQPRPDSRYGACHCIDIPFALDNPDEWLSAPAPPEMLAGCDTREFNALSRAVQRSWAAFARLGCPGHRGLPFWPEYTASNPNSMQFDVESRLAVNADGYISELWKAHESLS